MNYTRINYFSTVNGLGVNTSLFVSGCDLKCHGCFNKEAWSFDVGKELTDEVIERIFKSIEPTYMSGLSILGGEPLADKNLDGVLDLVKKFRDRFGNTKKIWLWSGRYLYDIDTIPMYITDEEEIKLRKKRIAILNELDYFVDGKFEQEKADPDLKFRGSSNQIIWEHNFEYDYWIKSQLNE